MIDDSSVDMKHQLSFLAIIIADMFLESFQADPAGTWCTILYLDTPVLEKPHFFVGGLLQGSSPFK